jgi:RND family efflux transporter MFP subunit
MGYETRPMASGPRLLLQVPLGLALTAAGLVGAQWIARTTPPPPPAPPRPTPAVTVTTRPLALEDLDREVRAHGLLDAVRQAALALPVPGSVARVHPGWRRGARVRAGEVLLELEAGAAEAAVARLEAGESAAMAAAEQGAVELASMARRVELARAAAGLAEGEVSRFERMDLASAGLESAADRARAALVEAQASLHGAESAERAAAAALSVAQARLREAGAALEEARVQVRRHRLEAPFDGVLTTEAPAPGTWVGPGLPVATLVDPAAWRARVRLPLGAAADLVVGQPARLRAASLGTEPVDAVVGALAVEADPASRTVAVDLDLDLGDGPADRVDGLLGAPVEADVALTPLSGVLVLRRAEITWRDGVALALVLERDGEVLRAAGRPLNLGRRSGDRVEVVGGLAPGEVLITAPLEALTPGSLVQIEEERPAPR